MTNDNKQHKPLDSTEPAIAYSTCYAPVPSSVKHPETYTESFIPKFAELLFGCTNVLDPFGGVGKLAMIKQHGFTGKVVCNELEREWAETGKYDVDEWHIGDAANIGWAASNSFDAICTSFIETEQNMTTTLTKKPTTDEMLEVAVEMLKVAIEMRKHQKAFFATRDAMELRKSKELEKQFDEMVLVYSGKVQIEDENDNQLILF